MSALSIRKFALAAIACVLAVLLLTLPAYAMPRGIGEMTANDITATTEPAPIEDGIGNDGTVTNDGEAKARGNLGDTDGDGIINRESTSATEQDPMHALQNMSARNGGWIVAAICIAAVITLVILIVALIPKKRM